MGAPAAEPSRGRRIGRYVLHGEIASGGMATVHFGHLVGPGGFSRTVAIKRLFPQFARDREFVDMILDEARLTARVRHPNVVPMLDVVVEDREVFLVMDYVHGESLARLLRHAKDSERPVPPAVLSAIVAGALHGLQAAHEATDEQGKPLHLVHRDMSPQNILVGADGVARVLDFGVAKALGRLHTTRDGRVKGKLAYMAPEQLKGEPTTHQADLFATAVVLWQGLCGRRLFDGESEALIIAKVLEERIVPPSRFAAGSSAALDEVTLRGLARDPRRRFSSAQEMALALEVAERPALTSEVSAWVKAMAGETLAARASEVAGIESGSFSGPAVGRSALDVEPGVPTVASQISTLSVSSHAHAVGDSRRSRIALWLAGAALLVCAALALPALRRAPPVPSTALPAVGPAGSVALATAIASEAPLAPPVTAEPSASPSATASASASRPAGRTTARPASQPAPHGPRSNCYTIDPQGIWHIRPSCL